MSMTTIEEFVHQLEPLTHAARVDAMIELGVQSVMHPGRSSTAESKALIAALEQGGFFERFMALYSCFGSRDSAQVRRALADPSRIIRGLAIRLLPLACDEAELQSALESVSPQLYLPILWKLRQHGQQGVIDRFLEALAGQETALLCPLLPFGSPALIARHAAQFRQQATRTDWQRLARFHPNAALDLLRQWANETSTPDEWMVNRINGMLPVLIRADADGALALVLARRRIMPLDKIWQRNLRLLIKARPKEMAEVIWAEREHFYTVSSGIVPWLSAEQISALYEQHRNILGVFDEWFRLLLPEQRLVVYTAVRQQFFDDDLLDRAIEALLPRERRAEEARTHMPLSQSEPETQRTFIKFLPWDEALAVLEPLLHASDSDLRQEALVTLIEVVKYYRSRLPDALTLLRTYRAEHDSVRRAFLESLGDLPPSIWREEHLPDLAEIIRHGLNDVGASPETLHVITNLALKLLPVHLEWAAAQLATVLRERGLAMPKGRGNNRFPAGLADEQVQRVLAEVLPILHTWLARDKESELLRVIAWFDGYTTGFEALLPLLTEMLQHTRARQTAEAIFGIIARQRFESFHTLIPALLAEDQSWITFSSVATYLHRQRQDLLAPFLAFQPYAGRWSTGRKRVLLPLPRRFTAAPAQQERYADTLMEMIGDDAQESQAQTQAVMLLAHLPAISAARLRTLAHDARPVVRTTALFALGRLDTDEGLPTLIEALQDARARIAVHVLRSFLLHMPPARALEIVRAIPMDRVTVAKERVRLIAEIKSEEAFQTLLALEQGDLHRDVRIALLRAINEHLDRPATWNILERAAQSTDSDIARAALPQTYTQLRFQERVLGEETTIEKHLHRIILMQLRHPDQEQRNWAMHYCTRFDFKDRQNLLVPRLLEIFAAPTGDDHDSAAEAILHVFVESQIPAIVQAVRALLPNRRALDAMESELLDRNTKDHPACEVLARALLPVLAEDPMTVMLRISLTCHYFPLGELAAFFQMLAEHNELHAEALMSACNILAGWYRPGAEIAQLEALEAALAASQDERLRRLALAVLKSGSKRRRTWDRQRLARLRAYRADPSVLVASAAQFTLPREELEEEES